MLVVRYEAIVLVFLACRAAFAQNTIADWFPLHVGDKWTYAHESRDDTGRGSAGAEIHRWTTEESIAGSWTIPEGVLIEKQVRITEGDQHAGSRVDLSSAYLLRGDCLYTTWVDWQPRDHTLKPEYRDALLAGHVVPDLCFPLAANNTWGAKDWQVKGQPDNQGIYHVASISSYPGSGETVDIWFQKGTGIYREEDIHHGTIGELRTWLVRFEPAAQR